MFILTSIKEKHAQLISRNIKLFYANKTSDSVSIYGTELFHVHIRSVDSGIVKAHALVSATFD